jgi:hypothetical protein
MLLTRQQKSHERSKLCRCSHQAAARARVADLRRPSSHQSDRRPSLAVTSDLSARLFSRQAAEQHTDRVGRKGQDIVSDSRLLEASRGPSAVLVPMVCARPFVAHSQHWQSQSSALY